MMLCDVNKLENLHVEAFSVDLITYSLYCLLHYYIFTVFFDIVLGGSQYSEFETVRPCWF
jgi:hypothetical protein